MSNIPHRDAETGQAIQGPTVPKMHTILHVTTTSGGGFAASFRRAALTVGRQAPSPSKQ